MKQPNFSAMSPAVAKAIEQMMAEQGDKFSLEKINLAELERRTGISRARLRRMKEHGFEDTRRRASPTWSLPVTVTLLSGRRTSVRTMLSCAPWTASLTMLWSLPLRGKASGEGSWRRLHCVLLPAHRLTHNRPGKQYCRGAGYPGLAIFVRPILAFFSRPNMVNFSRPSQPFSPQIS